MRFFVLFFAFLLSSSVVAQCIEDNSDNCTALGYDQPSCPFGGVACPFDTSKWHCADWQCVDGRYFDDADEQWWTDCVKTSYKGKTCYDCSCEIPTPDCQIGDMFYADKTCTKKYGDCLGKKPIGIVFMLTDEAGNITNWNDDGSIDYSATSRHGRIVHTRVLSLDTSNYKFNPDNPYNGGFSRTYWGLMGKKTALTSIGSAQLAQNLIELMGQEAGSNLYAGKESTRIIAETEPGGTNCTNEFSYEKSPQKYAQYCFPSAAYACLNFYPPDYDKDDLFLGQGQWYLPSLGEILQLYGTNPYEIVNGDNYSGAHKQTLNKVIASLNLLKTKNVPVFSFGDFHWTSTEVSYLHAWAVGMTTGGRATSQKHYDTPYARPVLAF